MRVFYKEEIEPVLDANDKHYFETQSECESISRTVYDNECVILPLYVLGTKSENLDINFSVDSLASNLDSAALPLDVEIFSVLNRDIVTSSGKKITSPITINNDKYIPIYIMIDCSYLGDKSNVIINLVASESRQIKVNLQKNGHMLHNKGADEIMSLVRLSWLNSTLYHNNKKSFVYDDVAIEDNNIKLYGKRVTLSREGYIENVASYITDNLTLSDKVQGELLDGGIKLIINDNINYDNYNIEKVGANINIHSSGEGDNVRVLMKCTVKYSGVMSYRVDVTAKNDTILDVEQVSMFSSYASKYMCGLGRAGGFFAPFNFKWKDAKDDSIFVGNVNVGATIKWMSENYSAPLPGASFKYKGITTPTSTWDNQDNGGIDVLIEKERAKINAYTGKIKLTKGEHRVFAFDVYLTPFHDIDSAKSFSDRYFETSRDKFSTHKMVSIAERVKLNRIVLDINSNTYSSINYPFTTQDAIREMTYEAHHNKIGVSLVYNASDISTRCPEIIPFANIEDGVIYRTQETDVNHAPYYEAMRQKLGNGVVAAERITYTSGDHKGEQNISALITPGSRYDNYYVEAVNWLVKECDIKGIELSNNVLSGTTIERVRKVVDRYKSEIELKLSSRDGNKKVRSTTLNNSIELLPYLDSVVSIGGGNFKNMTPEQLLIEVSGLTYGIKGHTTEIDPFLGLLFGMTSRYGYNDVRCDKLYKLFTKADIVGSEIHGFWSKDALVATDPGVKITYYKKGTKVLICMYNFNNSPAVFNVNYSPLKIKGIMKSFPMSKLIINQKFKEDTTVVLYNKCGVFMLADVE